MPVWDQQASMEIFARHHLPGARPRQVMGYALAPLPVYRLHLLVEFKEPLSKRDPKLRCGFVKEGCWKFDAHATSLLTYKVEVSVA